jgi:hypothetical protein
MNAREYFKDKKGITPEVAFKCDAKYTAIDIVRFAEEYHQQKSQEEAEERYKEAVKDFVMTFDTEPDWPYDRMFRIASGKE